MPPYANCSVRADGVSRFMGTLNFTCGTKYSRHVSGDAAIPERLLRFPWGSPFIFIAV